MNHVIKFHNNNKNNSYTKKNCLARKCGAFFDQLAVLYFFIRKINGHYFLHCFDIRRHHYNNTSQYHHQEQSNFRWLRT